MDKLNRPEQALVQDRGSQLVTQQACRLPIDHEVHLAAVASLMPSWQLVPKASVTSSPLEPKGPPRLHHINIALQRLATMAPDHKPIFITAYVNPKQGQELKERGIAFIDTVGNAYIQAGQVYVYIRGNRPEEPIGIPRQATSVFQATGLRVLFGFLHNPALLNANYRDIARATGVAHGTVGWVLTDLREAGYLIRNQRSGAW